MTIKSFDERLDRIQWQPGVVPTREMVDRMMGQTPRLQPRGVELTLAGAILGIIIGIGLKGLGLPDSPWGPGTGLPGMIAAPLATAGLTGSILLALFAAVRHRSLPRLMQFASINLLMIAVMLMS
ncbi:hypothetical protein ACUXV3_03925 [Roseobacteraceae bacterium NS-SX3]